MRKTHVIDGKKYVEVDRKADVGDKIYSDWSGQIYTVKDVDASLAIITKPGQLGHINGFYHGDYVVLQPTPVGACCENEPTVDSSQASEQVIEMLANLARRVTSLESQLAATQRNLETFAEQTENLKNTQRFYNDKTSDVEFTVDMILHDIAGISDRIKKNGGASK
jgi:hypothetical protein